MAINMQAVKTAICNFFRTHAKWIQLFFATAGFVTELLATYCENKWKEKTWGSDAAVGVAIGGLFVSSLFYYMLGKLEGINFRFEYGCIPVGRGGDNSPRGSAMGILGLSFWCVHCALAIVDCILKHMHKEIKLGFAIYPLVFAGFELLHAFLICCRCTSRNYYFRCLQRFDSPVTPEKFEGCHIIMCPACTDQNFECREYDEDEERPRQWLLTPPPGLEGEQVEGEGGQGRGGGQGRRGGQGRGGQRGRGGGRQGRRGQGRAGRAGNDGN